MILRELFESKSKSVGIIFGRFNPPHMGHMKAWEMASENSAWYVGTNKSTQGPKDPLPFDIKVKAMDAVYPAIKGHIVAEQSWLTLASKVYEKHGNIVLNVYTDEAWVTKALVQYNGKEGAHGYYEFGTIQQQDTPRLSSATALRNAVAADDRDLFGQAAGVDPNTLVAGHPFFDVVKHYLMPHAEKAAAKVVKKKVKEPVELDEGPSLPSTLKSIATNGEPITQLYGKLKAMAKRWVDNNGSLKGFHRNAAGQSAQWFNNFYFNKLQNDLYALAKQAPKYAPPLIAFLKDASEDRERHINFTEISRSLPPILFQIGKRMGDESLARFAHSWKARKDEYDSYLSQLEAEADMDDEYDEPEVKPEKSKVPGQQNAQVEQIVNDILAKLPKKVAGDIRNAIARAPNKLQALQQELSKRKIQGVTEGREEKRALINQYASVIAERVLMKGSKKKILNEGDLEVLKPDGKSDDYNSVQFRIDGKTVERGSEDFDYYYKLVFKKNPPGGKDDFVDTLKGMMDKDYGSMDADPMKDSENDVQNGDVIIPSHPKGEWVKISDIAEAGSNAIDTVAKRLTDPKDGMTAKLRAAGDKRREDKLKGRNISRRDTTSKDEWGNLKQENAWDRLQRERALESAGVGIITKQNSTVDVNKNTPKKNLKAFRLI